MSIGLWAQEAIFTRVWVSRVDGLSTDTPVLGRHRLRDFLFFLSFFAGYERN